MMGTCQGGVVKSLAFPRDACLKVVADEEAEFAAVDFCVCVMCVCVLL